ncbi:MAG TPA: hypothetical protein VFQ22_07790 [Longimicrobiales bacterium]|nr:hypothetical protein [Longimicrobiales bacterium]
MRRLRSIRTSLLAWALGLLVSVPVPAAAQDGPSEPAVTATAGDSTSGDGETCQGVITSIDIDSRSIFDPESTSIAPLAWAYRVLNLVHVNTRDSFIRRELLFEEGDCYDPFLVSESYRLLDNYGFMMVEDIRVEDDGSGGQHVIVQTRDEWSTKVDVGLTYDEGRLNLERFQATEENFLGQGVFFEYTYYARREARMQSVGLRTPRFFGRSDAGISGGTTRAGKFFEQYWRYPFVGEAGRVAVRQGYDVRTDFFAYSTGDAEAFTQVLLPLRREVIELAGAYRFGRPGASWIVGGSLRRDVVTFPDPPEITFGDFDEHEPLAGDVPEPMARQLRPFSATRAALHLGARRLRYVNYSGLDDITGQQLVGLGLFAGVSVGRTLPIFESGRAPAEDDWFARAHLSYTVPFGPSLFHAGATFAAHHPDAGWQDILVDGDLVAYIRGRLLPWQTLFFRVSSAGGWRTTLPFQLALGGRQGVRSLEEDRYPGGRMLRFVAEDRIGLPWPDETIDLGFTLFTDVGRVWPGDVPYGVDSGWKTALGVGLRIGLPKGTRHIWRADVAFPVGGGSPIFRVSMELNRLAGGFFTPDVSRSRRFTLGAETF